MNDVNSLNSEQYGKTAVDFAASFYRQVSRLYTTFLKHNALRHACSRKYMSY